ncbi:hypothetical protein [Mycetocola reblochoni]|uniref:hypothetical protein n=1 Tax=Mycetocola reblochoni TaxID=331618 RepID=UPI001FE8AFB1|nr:hypothetical protein [Mycetocola reblochoni]
MSPATGGSARRGPVSRAVAAVALWPWWVQLGLIWLGSRVLTTVMLLGFARDQEVNPWTGASPSYADFAAMWDSRWYQIVAASGYPSELPITDDGHVGENAWAFMPVYPMVVRALTGLTGLGWAAAAVVVSVACATAAVFVLYRLLRLRLDHGTALVGATLFSVAPVSPILQLGYAESLHALLLVCSLLLVMRRNYLAAAPLIVVASFTRPTGLAFSLFLLLLWIVRMVRRARAGFPVRERWTLAVTAALSGVAGLAWPAIAWAVTGSVTAYTDTELAWRSVYIGHQHLVPFAAWFQGLDWWTQRWVGVPLGWLVVPALVALGVWGLRSRAGARMGIEVRLWLLSYGVYLLAVFFPQSSTFRLLLPLFPVVGMLAVPRSAAYRTALIAACIVLQWWWIDACWRVDGADWTPP